MDEIDSKETPGIEGQTEAVAEPETSEDVKSGDVPVSGDDVDGGVSTGREEEGVSESNGPNGDEVGVEDLVASGVEATKSGPDDSSEDTAEDTKSEADDSSEKAAIESKLQSVKLWCLSLQKKVIAGLVIARQHKKEVIAGIGLGLLISPLVASGLKHWHTDPEKAPSTTQVYLSSVMIDSCADSYSYYDSYSVLHLAAFVVLLPDDEDLAYFSLSFAVKLSNSNVYWEIEKKKAFFRGVIYRVLDKAVKDSSSEMMSKKGQLKQDIISALNGFLITGTIEAIYFTQFLVV